MKPADISGIILAGGQASRLGGVDKGLQLYRGRPLIEYMIDSLLPVVGGLYISANRNLDSYRAYGHPVIPDSTAGFAGPLAGLLSLLPVLESEFALVVPCDMPALSASVMHSLLDALQRQGKDLLLAADPLRQHYSVFACRVAPSMAALQATWDEGGRSLRAWQQRLNSGVEMFQDTKLFLNCNTPDMLVG